MPQDGLDCRDGEQGEEHAEPGPLFGFEDRHRGSWDGVVRGAERQLDDVVVRGMAWFVGSRKTGVLVVHGRGLTRTNNNTRVTHKLTGSSGSTLKIWLVLVY